MTTAVNHKLADPKAVAVARAVQDAAPQGAVVILFGSRARGDYNARSDVDLMMLVPDREGYYNARAAVSETARAAAQREYGFAMPVDVVQLDHPPFSTGPPRRQPRCLRHHPRRYSNDPNPILRY